MFGINKYAFWGIIVIAVTILLIVIIIVHVVKYHIKQKNLTIREYLKNNISYKENMKQYDKKLEEAGITSKKKREKLIQEIGVPCALHIR